MSIWNAGDPFIARDSEANRSCGITTETSGYVTCVLGDRVSFFVESRGRGGSRIEASCDLGTFSHSFVPHPYLGNNPGYSSAGVASARFPDDIGKR